MENDRELGGLYYLDSFAACIISFKVNFPMYCVSKLTWNSILGYVVDQALNSLKDKLQFANISVLPCDVCYKATQTRESFSLSDNVSSKLGELIHLDF